MKPSLSLILFLLICVTACSPTPQVQEVTPTPVVHTGELRVVYSKLADPWIWIEGEGTRQLADSENVMEVVISSDGQVVAFKRDDTGELFAVNADGSNLHPLVNAEYLTSRNAAVWTFDFAPGSHTIFFTLIEAGNSFSPFYDLNQVDADATAPLPEMVFAPGQGGIARFSPDGQWMTLYYMGGLDLAKTDGSATRTVFSYPQGYEPATFGPELVWMEDSSGFALYHLPDPMLSVSQGGLCFVPVDGEPQDKFPVNSTWGVPSPDGQRLGYSTPGTPSEIHIVEADGTDAIYKTFGNAWFRGWSPDSQHFIVFVEEVKNNRPVYIPYVCRLGVEPRPLTDTDAGDPVMWLTADEFLFASWGDLRLQRLGEPSLELDSQINNIFDYTVITP